MKKKFIVISLVLLVGVVAIMQMIKADSTTTIGSRYERGNVIIYTPLPEHYIALPSGICNITISNGVNENGYIYEAKAVGELRHEQIIPSHYGFFSTQVNIDDEYFMVYLQNTYGQVISYNCLKPSYAVPVGAE